MCLLWSTNWVFISQKTTFFIVTAVNTRCLSRWTGTPSCESQCYVANTVSVFPKRALATWQSSPGVCLTVVTAHCSVSCCFLGPLPAVKLAGAWLGSRCHWAYNLERCCCLQCCNSLSSVFMASRLRGRHPRNRGSTPSRRKKLFTCSQRAGLENWD
jgi:hypothetical protein